MDKDTKPEYNARNKSVEIVHQKGREARKAKTHSAHTYQSG